MTQANQTSKVILLDNYRSCKIEKKQKEDYEKYLSLLSSQDLLNETKHTIEQLQTNHLSGNIIHHVELILAEISGRLASSSFEIQKTLNNLHLSLKSNVEKLKKLMDQ